MPRRNVAVTHGTLEESQAGFLRGLESGLSVGAAASAVGYSRNAVYSWRDQDSAFAARWNEAKESACDAAESELYRRGVAGVPRRKPHLYRGRVVHTERFREYSDTALIAWLRANRPGKYRDDRPNDQAAGVQVVIYIPDNGRPVGPGVQMIAPIALPPGDSDDTE